MQPIRSPRRSTRTTPAPPQAAARIGAVVAPHDPVDRAGSSVSPDDRARGRGLDEFDRLRRTEGDCPAVGRQSGHGTRPPAAAPASRGLHPAAAATSSLVKIIVVAPRRSSATSGDDAGGAAGITVPARSRRHRLASLQEQCGRLGVAGRTKDREGRRRVASTLGISAPRTFAKPTCTRGYAVEALRFRPDPKRKPGGGAPRSRRQGDRNVHTDAEQDNVAARHIGRRSDQEDRRSRMESELRPGGDDLPHRLQDHQGAARPDEAGAALLLPDAGREGQSRLWRARRGAARRHVPQCRAALGRVDEALPRHHPVPGDFGGAVDGDGGAARARRGPAHRLHHADGRRVPPLHDPDESEEVVHGELYRSGRLRHHRRGVRQVLRDHHRAPVRRGLHHRRHDDRRLHVSDGRRRDGVHQHAVRRDAVRGRAQRRLCAADGVPVGPVGREPAHRQRPFAADGGAEGAGEPPPARARPALRLLAEPCDRRCGDRHLHRIRHHQPRQDQGVLRGNVAPLDLRGLLPHLHAAAREVRREGASRRRP